MHANCTNMLFDRNSFSSFFFFSWVSRCPKSEINHIWETLWIMFFFKKGLFSSILCALSLVTASLALNRRWPPSHLANGSLRSLRLSLRALFSTFLAAVASPFTDGLRGTIALRSTTLPRWLPSTQISHKCSPSRIKTNPSLHWSHSAFGSESSTAALKDNKKKKRSQALASMGPSLAWRAPWRMTSKRALQSINHIWHRSKSRAALRSWLILPNDFGTHACTICPSTLSSHTNRWSQWYIWVRP